MLPNQVHYFTSHVRELDRYVIKYDRRWDEVKILGNRDVFDFEGSFSVQVRDALYALQLGVMQVVRSFSERR